MSTYGSLPLGIRNRNPGGLLCAYRSPRHVPIVEGIAQFATPEEGLANLLRFIEDIYSVFGKKTLRDFVLFYQSRRAFDALSYIRALSSELGIADADPACHRLTLDTPEARVALAKAIVVVENGAPPAKWPAAPLWYADGQYEIALRAVGDRR